MIQHEESCYYKSVNLSFKSLYSYLLLISISAYLAYEERTAFACGSFSSTDKLKKQVLIV